jgi:hypothetical protein
MRTIIAGSRSITDFKVIEEAIKASSFSISEVVSGGAKGVDLMGEKFANDNNIPIKVFKPSWSDLDVSGSIIKENKYGKFNARAGVDRNERMGNYADALIAVWDGNSKGTIHMINYMKKLNKKVFVYRYASVSCS